MITSDVYYGRRI